MSRRQGAQRIAAAAGRGKAGSSPRGFGGVRSCPLGFILRCWTPEARENECLLCQPPAYDTLLRAAPGRHAGSSQLTWCPNACDLEAPWALQGSGSPFQDHFVIFRVVVHLSSPTQAHTPASQVPRFVPLGTPLVRPASISLGFVTISAGCSLQFIGHRQAGPLAQEHPLKSPRRCTRLPAEHPQGRTRVAPSTVLAI